MTIKTLYADRKEQALNKLLELADGRKVFLARELKTSVQSVQMWFMRKQISKPGALKIEEHPYFSLHITKEELRPDIDWN